MVWDDGTVAKCDGVRPCKWVRHVEIGAHMACSFAISREFLK